MFIDLIPPREAVLTYQPPSGRESPVLFEVPHSGRDYPNDFGAALPVERLRFGEDRFVDQLVAAAPSYGAHLLVAHFARTYIDPNRAESQVEPALLSAPWPHPIEAGAHTALGLGLVFRRVGKGEAIYDRLLAPEEIAHRIEHYYRPYHARLEAALEDIRARRDVVFHVTAHSMNSVGNALSPDEGRTRPDFVLGDRRGTSCDPAFTEVVERILGGLGYSVARNDPFQGGELVIRYGRVELQQHSLQIEMKRSLYMDEETLEPHGGFDRLRRDLNRFTQSLCDWAQKRAR